MYNIPQEMIDEFNKEMKHISENQWRTEDAHIEMDDVMCNTLRKLGFEKGIEIFEHTEKWYS
jgi:hypothetical protein